MKCGMLVILIFAQSPSLRAAQTDGRDEREGLRRTATFSMWQLNGCWCFSQRLKMNCMMDECVEWNWEMIYCG